MLLLGKRGKSELKPFLAVGIIREESLRTSEQRRESLGIRALEYAEAGIQGVHFGIFLVEDRVVVGFELLNLPGQDEDYLRLAQELGLQKSVQMP